MSEKNTNLESVRKFNNDMIDFMGDLVELSLPHVKSAKWLVRNDPSVSDVWLNPDNGLISIRTSCMNAYTIKESGLDSPEVLDVSVAPAASWVPLAITVKTGSMFDRVTPWVSDMSECPENETGELYTIKSAADDSEGESSASWLRGRPVRFTGHTPNEYSGGPLTLAQRIRGLSGWNDALYNPSPLAAMLAGGVLGAGLGYGGAALASLVLPSTWDKRKMRRTGFLLGGAAGASPGAVETMRSVLIGQPVLDGRHMERVPGGVNSREDKSAGFSSGFGTTVDAGGLIRSIWEDPAVSGRLSNKEKTLATGSLTATQAIAGSSMVTPYDMARLTAGMGTGYASGLVAGKVLGALTGMPTGTQQQLANMGVYAGVVKSVLPVIFGGRR